MSAIEPIEKCMADWTAHMKGEYEGGLDRLLADDVVFFSPIVFTGQKGKDLTKLYLGAAGNTFGGDDGGEGNITKSKESKFRYVKKVISGNHAVLEFETEMDGKYVNGVDIITCNDDGKIVEFKVMIRPLQAIQTVHAQMAAMLKKMDGAS